MTSRLAERDDYYRHDETHMTGPKIRVMVDLLEEHLEELAFLWGQRSDARTSPDYSVAQFGEVEQRIGAHLQALLVGGDAADALLEQGLADDDPPVAFAAAYTLLQRKDAASADRVLDALGRVESEPREGIAQALCFGPIEPIEDRLRQAVESESASVAVVAAEALAAHGRPFSGGRPHPAWFEDEDPSVRRAAWRVIGLLATKDVR